MPRIDHHGCRPQDLLDVGPKQLAPRDRPHDGRLAALKDQRGSQGTRGPFPTPRAQRHLQHRRRPQPSAIGYIWVGDQREEPRVEQQRMPHEEQQTGQQGRA